jgi:Aldehyde dehydrogenase family
VKAAVVARHYGLAAYVWSHDLGRVLRAAHATEAGWVQVNQGLGQSPGHDPTRLPKADIEQVTSPDIVWAAAKVGDAPSRFRTIQIWPKDLPAPLREIEREVD